MVKEFAFINFFRALAAFWVLIGHCMIWTDWSGIWWPDNKLAVDVFMIISGYLMAANALARRHTEPLTASVNWLRFWFRRFFRIAPVYYLTLLLAASFSSHFLGGYAEWQRLNPSRWPPGGIYDPSHFEYTLSNLAVHASFLFGLFPQYSQSTFLPDWSLGLEMQFYAVFPMLMLLTQRFGSVRIALGLGLPVFFAGYVLNKSVHFPEPSLLLFKLNYFLAGMLLVPALDDSNDVLRRRLHVAAAALLVSVDIRYRFQLLILPLLLLSMYTIGRLELRRQVPRWLQAIINGRVTRFASEVSYGVYLLHGFFLSGAGLLLSRQAFFVDMSANQRFALVVVFVIVWGYVSAYLVYRFVELPGIALGKRLLARFLPARAVIAT